MEMNAGYRMAELTDPQNDGRFPMAVLYPTAFPEKTERLGPYHLDIAMNAPPDIGSFPLVLISHGSGGSYLVYRLLAQHLARCGFIVGLPEHPFNNRHDNTLEGTLENLHGRPRHLKAALDWFHEGPFAPLLKTGAVSVIGHSMGGYAALALAGGVPMSFPREEADGVARRLDVAHDDRVRALVLLAPASVWFRAEDALRGVRMPVLMMIGDKDTYTPYMPHGHIVAEGVPDPALLETRIIENAGHFPFLGPFPAALTKPTFPPSQDPPGFDRLRFLDTLNHDVAAFLLKNAG